MGMKLREMGRLRKIAVVLLRQGLGHLVDKLGLSGRAGKGKSPKEEVLRLSEAERVRMAFEELGPTFVKFGQVMSLRSDVLPDNLIVELKKLQDACRLFPLRRRKMQSGLSWARPSRSFTVHLMMFRLPRLPSRRSTGPH